MFPCRWWRGAPRKQYTLTDLDDNTGGPARYVRVSETGGKLALHHASHDP